MGHEAFKSNAAYGRVIDWLMESSLVSATMNAMFKPELAARCVEFIVYIPVALSKFKPSSCWKLSQMLRGM